LVGELWLSDFLNNSHILPRIKVENFLLVSLGLRPCSQMTLPAELQNAESMASAIDEKIFPKIRSIQSEPDPRKKLMLIGTLKKEMRRTYERFVKDTEICRSHLSWAEGIGLRKMVVDVRPTVEELYIFEDKDIGKKLRKLMKDREKCRANVIASARPGMERSRYVFPEEFQGSWIREIGRILGYPACCVEAYASNREDGINVEFMASQQIEEATKLGTVNPLTYFVGYFFPCSPCCDEALARGSRCRERLSELHPGLGEIYLISVAENMERVRHQPEITEKYKARARGDG
jgi:hemerythrin superfamily protein